ncbi:hypothetical protein QJS10_CPA07g00423 [Acorus calamus]|uniref:Uncharacterized protein n=1 Tax=Acorus calamus TaxID=4465 RepID=A0AAV9EF64_ACOCL|nr:hypothetical protein QJS10_CPA07g00423 [Acorus calamus]
MLLAVEGGGFFSSSASGYSKGLTLLLLGQVSEEKEKPMRVSPCYQYQLVEQEEPDPDLQLASKKKNRVSRGCASFICFGRPSTSKPNDPSMPNVGCANLQSSTSVSDNGEAGGPADGVNDESTRKVCLKSSLKKPPAECSVEISRCIDDGKDACGVQDEDNNDVSICAERRKVQWTDSCGRELVEIREFELSELGASDDEHDQEGNRRCECVIQ